MTVIFTIHVVISGNCFPEDSPYAPFQRFDYTLGSTKICVSPNEYSETQYCIDFGTNLGSNGQTLYIWQAYDVPQQQLYITDDQHIAVVGGNQCADVKAESGPQPDYARPYGSLKDLQSWQCTQYNTNQVSIDKRSLECGADDSQSDLHLHSLECGSQEAR
jgi:hypothetical protein